jgi:hypothetical protein
MSLPPVATVDPIKLCRPHHSPQVRAAQAIRDSFENWHNSFWRRHSTITCRDYASKHRANWVVTWSRVALELEITPKRRWSAVTEAGWDWDLEVQMRTDTQKIYIEDQWTASIHSVAGWTSSQVYFHLPAWNLAKIGYEGSNDWIIHGLINLINHQSVTRAPLLCSLASQVFAANHQIFSVFSLFFLLGSSALLQLT